MTIQVTYSICSEYCISALGISILRHNFYDRGTPCRIKSCDNLHVKQMAVYINKNDRNWCKLLWLNSAEINIFFGGGENYIFGMRFSLVEKHFPKVRQRTRKNCPIKVMLPLGIFFQMKIKRLIIISSDSEGYIQKQQKYQIFLYMYPIFPNESLTTDYTYFQA